MTFLMVKNIHNENVRINPSFITHYVEGGAYTTIYTSNAEIHVLGSIEEIDQALYELATAGNEIAENRALQSGSSS